MNNLYLFLNIITIFSTYLHIKYIESTNINEFKSLPDLFVDNLPDLSSNLINKLVDYLLLLWTTPILFYGNNEMKGFMYKFTSIIFLLRTFTKFFTIIPSQGKTCKNDSSKLECYISGYCNDKIFSGHTAITLTCLLIIIDNKLIDSRFNSLLKFFHLIYVFLILSAKNHYSVDVILSYIITTSLYYNLRDKL